MQSKFIAIVILFCFIIGTVFSSQTMDEMENIATETDLINLYQNSDNYTRRYILKYLPEWMENRGISVPSTFYSVIEDAVSADNCYLVEEAVILVGKYQIESSFDEMDALYENVMNQFPQYGTYIRGAIINALLDAPDGLRSNYIAKFLGYRPTGFLLSEFSGLIYAASQYCDQSVIPLLYNFKAEILNEATALEQSNPDKYGRYKSLYDKVINEIDEAGELINERSQ